MKSPTRSLQSGKVNRGSREKRVTLSVPMTEATKRKVEQRAIADKMTMSEVGRRAIIAYLTTKDGA